MAAVHFRNELVYTHIYMHGVSEIGRHILDSLAVDQNITKALHMNTYPR
jgi:hypothetical protein